MRRILIAVLACALAVLSLGAPAGAKQVDKEVERPFKVTFTGGTTGIEWADGVGLNPTATSTFDGRCPAGASWLITNSGTGSGTYLGDFTWTSVHCTLITSLDPPNALLYAGWMEFTAANGDMLYESYEPVGGIVFEGDKMCADTAGTFEGGTGRFANASGAAVEHGCWPASLSPVISDLLVKSVGTITFDASDRRL